MASKMLKKCPECWSGNLLLYQHCRSHGTPMTKEPLIEGLIQKKPAGLDVTYASLRKRTVKELQYLYCPHHHHHVAHSKCPASRLTQPRLKDSIALCQVPGAPRETARSAEPCVSCQCQLVYHADSTFEEYPSGGSSRSQNQEELRGRPSPTR